MKKIFFLISTVVLLASCQSQNCIVVYTSVDQVYSEPIFEDFESKSGISVKAVYDVEASKSVGLANRLIAESNNPQADLFWNGEILQTIKLRECNVLQPLQPPSAEDYPPIYIDEQNMWIGFGGRARVLLYNKTLIDKRNCPTSLQGFLNHPRIAESAIAQPTFGTSLVQAAALYAIWGKDDTRDFYQSLYKKGVKVLAGNSVVKDYVSLGKCCMGLTDSDDALNEMAKNSDLDIILLDQNDDEMGTLIIPNSIALIKGAPNKAAAQAFIDYLISRQTEQYLVDIGWIHIPLHDAVAPPQKLSESAIKPLAVDFSDVYQYLDLVVANCLGY